ncbi:MAG: sodium/proline symporter [Planctomycetota bacterium]|nr:MAG: sodium/proline symporter [Planctomycetota bacterium]
MTVAIWSFILSLLAMTAVGALSYVNKKEETEDYLLASREVPAWLSALSAVSTNNSGFMFIGMIGYTYRLGIESIWLMIGWIAGDLCGWLFFYPRIRSQSEELDVNTMTGLFAKSGDRILRALMVAGGAITFVFLGVYASGQLKAGSTALHALFGWDLRVGALIAAGIVILYSFAGGIRADIWTDAAQSCVMIFSMIALVVTGWMEIGGPAALFENLEGQDPALTGLFPKNARFGLIAWLLGMAFTGFGAIGQPHLMTRYMAIKSVESMKSARVYYFLWYIPFFVSAIIVGLYCRALIPELAEREVARGLDEPTELALPIMAMELLPQVMVGITLAGLFAAIVSTADSQIIVCSGSLTNDIFPRWKDSYLASKIGTLTITALSLGIALLAPEGVFSLVLIAWSAMGASLGSILALSLLGRRPPQSVSLTMMAVAILVVIVWQVSDLDQDVFEMFPAMVAAFSVYGGWLGIRALKSRKTS